MLARITIAAALAFALAAGAARAADSLPRASLSAEDQRVAAWLKANIGIFPDGQADAGVRALTSAMGDAGYTKCVANQLIARYKAPPTSFDDVEFRVAAVEPLCGTQGTRAVALAIDRIDRAGIRPPAASAVQGAAHGFLVYTIALIQGVAKIPAAYGLR